MSTTPGCASGSCAGCCRPGVPERKVWLMERAQWGPEIKTLAQARREFAKAVVDARAHNTDATWFVDKLVWPAEGPFSTTTRAISAGSQW